jgi:hypothetical protein
MSIWIGFLVRRAEKKSLSAAPSTENNMILTSDGVIQSLGDVYIRNGVSAAALHPYAFLHDPPQSPYIV